MGRVKKTEAEEEKKVRKRVSGPLRDKERSVVRLIAAVGVVIQKKGYSGLTGLNIANEADLDKSLIYRYFGSIDTLVETYILQKDFWSKAEKNIIADLLNSSEPISSADIAALLRGQLEKIYKDKVLQKIIHWELGEKNKTLRKIADKREEIGEQLFHLIEPDFASAGIDVRARLAIQIAGIYYLVLHARNNGSLFCGLDINRKEDLMRLEKVIEENVQNIFEEKNK